MNWKFVSAPLLRLAKLGCLGRGVVIMEHLLGTRQKTPGILTAIGSTN